MELNEEDTIGGIMFSRLGKTCSEQMALVDKAHNSTNKEKKLERKPDAPALVNRGRFEKTDAQDVVGFFKYYQSMEREQKESNEKSLQFEKWQAEKNSYNKPSDSLPPPPLSHQRNPSLDRRPVVGQYYPHYSQVFSSSPQFGLAKSAKRCFFEETAKRHIANTSKLASSGFEKTASVTPRGNVCFNAQSSRPSLPPSISKDIDIILNSGNSTTPMKHTREIKFSNTIGRPAQLFQSTMTNQKIKQSL